MDSTRIALALVFNLILISHYGLTTAQDGDEVIKPGPVPKKYPNILLRKQKTVENSLDPGLQVMLDPADCVYTHFLAPFSEQLKFPSKEQQDAISGSSVCSFNFIGTEACTPMLECPTFSLPEDCSQANMSVTDGFRGKEYFCGEEGPKGVIASNALRDLFVKINGGNAAQFALGCTITCTHRGKGSHMLEQTMEPKVNKRCKCGTRAIDDRIVNGYDAKKVEFPWIAAVVEAGTRQPFCGATVINDRFLITAAHCFKGKYMDYRRVQLLISTEVLDITHNGAVLKTKPPQVIYTPEQLAAVDAGNGTVRLDIEEVFIHPLYVSETNDFDVAVVKVAQTINITDPATRPVCLPPLGSYALTYAHKDAIVAGWGLPYAGAPGTVSQMQKLNVSIFSPRLCKEMYVHRVNKRMMCAGYKEGGKDSCMGDSGGPLIVETSPKVWTLVGTVSWGEGCAQAENPGVYYRTTESGQWATWVSNENDATWCDTPPMARHG